MVDAYTEPINPSPLFISPMEIPDIKDKNTKQCPFPFSRRARVTNISDISFMIVLYNYFSSSLCTSSI